MFQKPKTVVLQQMFDIDAAAGVEVVETDDLMAPLEKALAKMRPQETGASVSQDGF